MGAIHGVAPRVEPQTPGGPTATAGKFGRLFPELEALLPPIEALHELGETMFESRKASPDNLGVPAAYTYLGQFIDHDLTFDATTLAESRVDPLAVWNYRTAAFDLDSVYGSGPAVQPWFYRRDSPDLFEIGCTASKELQGRVNVPTAGLQADLPRASNRHATIADTRNDENLIISQLHLAFLHFHNNVVESLRAGPREARWRKSLFDEARDTVTRHYQWMVLNDFLPKIVAKEDIDSVIEEGSRLSATGRAFIPVEFSAAVYRFGHTMVRPVYNYNVLFKEATLEELFAHSGRRGDPASVPKVPIGEEWIPDWGRLLARGDRLSDVHARQIDPYLADAMKAIPTRDGPKPLSTINLQRGWTLGLPSGQSIARMMRCEPLKPDQFGGPDGEVAKKHGLDIETPLWYYILKEAEVIAKGKTLGPVGGRIVADVFFGLMELDPNSVLSRGPGWEPTLTGSEFTLAHMLRYAGVLDDPGKKPRNLHLRSNKTVLPGMFP